MIKISFLAMSAILFFLGCSDSNKDTNNEMTGLKIDKIKPIRGLNLKEEQSVGFYSQGELFNAKNLPEEGFGYLKIFRPRNRGWASNELIKIVEGAAEHIKNLFPATERLQIADFSAKNGGYVSGHASHQNGLDVDIIYYRNNRYEYDPYFRNINLEEFVENGQLTNNFDIERNWELVKYFVENAPVNRMFIDQVIKKSFCEYTKAQGIYQENIETLRRIRHWPNHANHLHLRLKCPRSSPRCQDQQEPPAGSGC